MALLLEEKNIKSFIMIGDRVLIKPKSPEEKTKSGLFLPPGVHEKEKLRSGYILKTGPGYPIPALTDVEEPWKEQQDVKYVPLQATEGDLAVFLISGAYEITFKKENYFIVPHSAILMLIRDEGLFE